MRLDVPKFSRVNPESWIITINEYFSLLNTFADQRLRIVGFNLEGAVVEWFRWMTRSGLITTWARFKESVNNRFGPSTYEDPNGASSRLLQLGTIEDYQQEFEKLMNRLARTIEARFDDKAASVAGMLAGLKANKVVIDGDDSESSGPVTPISDSESSGKVLIESKQDEAKVMQVVDEQNSDEPDVLKGNGVIVHKEEKDEGCNAKKIMGSQNQDNFFKHHLEDKESQAIVLFKTTPSWQGGFEGLKKDTPRPEPITHLAIRVLVELSPEMEPLDTIHQSVDDNIFQLTDPDTHIDHGSVQHHTPERNTSSLPDRNSSSLLNLHYTPESCLLQPVRYHHFLDNNINDTTFAVKRPGKDLILNDVKQFTFSWISERIKKAKDGNSFKPVAQTTTNDVGTSTTLIQGPVTTEEKAQKKNDVKARSMLLMKIVSQLAILGVFISHEDLNLNFLRGLPFEWNTHVVVWRNKSDLDTMSIDYLYNNFKIVEQEVKETACSDLSSQNMAFVTSSSTNSTNEVSTAYGVSTASTQSSTASTKVSTANLSNATVYAFLSNQSNGSQLVHEDLEQIHEDDLEEID
nr:hypothetical protein [Tanacetum cinerariifolium]